MSSNACPSSRLSLALALSLAVSHASCGGSSDGAAAPGDGASGDGTPTGDGANGDGAGGDGTPTGDGKCERGAYDGKDDVVASQEPPCGLKVAEVPLFVSIGFDDNGDADGLTWALDMLKARSAQVTFFATTSYGADDKVLAAWKRALTEGHELGNHTVTHLPNHGGRDWDAAKWMVEIEGADTFLKEHEVGSALYGFRTPYLEYSDGTLADVKSIGYQYDASIEEGYEDGQDGTNFFWPYTLDHKSPGHTVQVAWGDGLKEITAHPGLWELPVYAVFAPPALRAALKTRQDWFDPEGGQITGFDYNLWTSRENGGFEMTKDEVLDSLKFSLDQRLAGNRAPFLFGAHTDYYVAEFDKESPKAKMADRRAAIEEFLDYALTKPEVRIVTFKELLDWLRNPTAK